mgnify:CR=1
MPHISPTDNDHFTRNGMAVLNFKKSFLLCAVPRNKITKDCISVESHNGLHTHYLGPLYILQVYVM